MLNVTALLNFLPLKRDSVKFYSTDHRTLIGVFSNGLGDELSSFSDKAPVVGKRAVS